MDRAIVWACCATFGAVCVLGIYALTLHPLGQLSLAALALTHAVSWARTEIPLRRKQGGPDEP